MELFKQPWRGLTDEELPNSARQTPGWLIPVERKLLWWIGKEYWKGLGAIVDAGAFCGASAVAFASGLCASANLTAAIEANLEIRRSLTGSQHGPIVSFDKFMNADSFEKSFIQDAYGVRIAKGDAFLDYYLEAVKPYLDFVRVEVGDFLEKRWNGQPIEILFLDICKTRALNAHAMGEFLPHLIPDHSLIIQQDFMGVWLPQINWSMQYLKEYFEIVDSECGPSRVYLLREKVPQDLIDDLTRSGLSLDTRMKLLGELHDESMAANAKHIAMLVEGMKLQELFLERQLALHDEMWFQFLDAHAIPIDATTNDFSGSNWVLNGIPNWIPRQIMDMHANRLRFGSR